MKRLLLVLAGAALLLPAAAHAVPCSPLTCAPSQFSLAQGALLGFRTAADRPVTVVDLQTGRRRFVLPAGITGGDLLVHQSGTTLVWYDAARDTRLFGVGLPSGQFSLAGVSQDGTRAVALDSSQANTKLVVLSRSASRTLVLQGSGWRFDALRGDNLFLIKVVDGGYQVRLAHLGSGRVERRPLKDPHESGTIWGQPFSRLPSADGRYLFTLYISSNGAAMVHELDLQTATARCIDLPGTGNYGAASSDALVLSSDGGTLWAVSPGYGRLEGIDVASRKVTSTSRLTLDSWSLGRGTSAALAPDGQHVALSDGEGVAVVEFSGGKVVQRSPGRAVALGYSPDGRLWKLA